MREINLIEIRPSAVARVLGAAAILLVILHVLANVGAFVFGYPSAKALVALFSFECKAVSLTSSPCSDRFRQRCFFFTSQC